MGKPFARANAMMAAVAAIIASATSRFAAQQQINGLASYESHGKGGKRAHRPTGIAGVRRAACKARNVKANRRAQR